MEELIKKIQELKDWELLNAYKIYGPHHSRHEAYAVLLEEVKETQKEMKNLKKRMKYIFEDIMADEEKLRVINEMLKGALCLAAEAVQVAAMVQKFIDFEEGK